ncbi:MAG: UDP-2,4-diacetamido-2,4,6-trideoxy-beta-L-altropyranose hydrolase [Deltaproteobacteria bacterium]|nr:UDP-2,4-diacetamido-2,4,6-trideoxy-beta-L-altropyranose hydrolase [Deltaproteobacteria bacterium]
MKRVLLRAEADPQIGLGHVIRCLALAEAVADRGGEAIFATGLEEGFLLSLLRRECADVVHPAGDGEFLELVRERRPDWVVLDGYRFGLDLERAVRSRGARLLAIDDGVRPEHDADALLDQNLGATPQRYRTPAGCSLLLGPAYLLLRREFRGGPAPRRDVSDPPRILVTMGGGDAGNHAWSVWKALRGSCRSPLEVRIVVSSLYRHRAELEAAAAADPLPTEVRVNPFDMSDEMRWADVAVSAGGSTVWELFRMGVPAVIGTVAPNQEETARELARRGLVRFVGALGPDCGPSLAEAVTGLLRDPDARHGMVCRAQEVVAGDPTARAAEYLLAAATREEKGVEP